MKMGDSLSQTPDDLAVQDVRKFISKLMGDTMPQVPDDSAVQYIKETQAKLMEKKSWQPDIADSWLQFITKFKPSDLETNSVLLSSLYREDGVIEEPPLLIDALDRCKRGEGSAEDNDTVIFAWMLTKNLDYFRALETNAQTELSAGWAASSLREQYPQWTSKIDST